MGEPTKNANSNNVYISSIKFDTKTKKEIGKSNSDYLLSISKLLNDGEKEIHLLARGGAIRRAIDITEIGKRKIGLNVKNVNIGTAIIENNDSNKKDRKFSVSFIDIEILPLH